MTKKTMIRVSRLEKVLAMVEKTTKAFDPIKAEGARIVIELIRDEIYQEERTK